MRKPEQQQQTSNSGGFTRRNSKKIQPTKTQGSGVKDKDLVYTKTTTYVEVSEPQVTVTEQVVASKVTNLVEPTALNLMSSNGGSLPFIDDPASVRNPQSAAAADTLKERRHVVCALYTNVFKLGEEEGFDSILFEP